MCQNSKRRKPIPLPKQYTAEIIRSDGETSKVFVDGSRNCIESEIAGMPRIHIWCPDLDVAYRIELDSKTYFTIPITPEMESMGAENTEDEIEWEYIGTENYNSHQVEVFDVFGKEESRCRSRIYVDKETHIRWKEVTFDKIGKEVLCIEMKNVVIGPPPPSVFELPPGLRELNMR